MLVVLEGTSFALPVGSAAKTPQGYPVQPGLYIRSWQSTRLRLLQTNWMGAAAAESLGLISKERRLAILKMLLEREMTVICWPGNDPSWACDIRQLHPSGTSHISRKPGKSDDDTSDRDSCWQHSAAAPDRDVGRSTRPRQIYAGNARAAHCTQMVAGRIALANIDVPSRRSLGCLWSAERPTCGAKRSSSAFAARDRFGPEAVGPLVVE